MISTESTPAIRAAAVGHRRVLGLALEQVGERVAHHVVEVEHRRRAASPAAPARSPRRGRAPRASRAGGARRRPAAGRGPRRPPASPAPRRSPGRRRRAVPPRGRCRRPASAPAASAPGRRRRSPRRTRSAGAISSSAGVAYCATRPPSRMTAIRSPILIASSMSWVTKRTVLPISACRRRNSFCSRSRLIGSIAPNGSSISITSGSAASARATPTRCCCPPESCAG